MPFRRSFMLHLLQSIRWTTTKRWGNIFPFPAQALAAFVWEWEHFFLTISLSACSYIRANKTWNFGPWKQILIQAFVFICHLIRNITLFLSMQSEAFQRKISYSLECTDFYYYLGKKKKGKNMHRGSKQLWKDLKRQDYNKETEQ